ncbi:YhgE/Pip domain-containing protein [Neobacillus vireti]|uniref:YhgE/Pip C-terminal domain-containing protein n=1 Tax=Neobacillus vireti LMG 21834 TaxID=1131730 RepID=A0AB94INT6_9BACI|nr:YhgE/Pip domain-containing protein [Neobacillus vireti]ETI68689.1 YhgE/Pip C-terminal domain-containing protein [Neobacillus vireti LMG 21834]KLT19189.1 membrane protein [Neobacillus vireti]
MKNILLKEELLTIFKNKKVLIPIIAVMFVPVMYAGMFLWAFWDPYDKLDELPVAVVNQDAGATLDGNHLKLGDDLVAKLKKSKDFGFEFVDKEEGYTKLKEQKYYMVIEIPKDFSKNATTLLDANPKKLELIYTPNESYNFLSAQIGGTAAEKIKTAVAEKVTETYAETMFSKITELAVGVVKASDGAGQLSDGSVDLNKGSKDLNEGLATLAKKSIEFNNGMKTADSGVKDIADGNKNLNNGLDQLLAGQKQLETASGQLENGSKDLQAGIKQAKDGIQTINGKMPEVVGSTEQIKTGANTLSTKLNEWQQGSKNAAEGAETLNQGIIALKTQLEQMMPLLGSLPDAQKAALAKGLQDLEDGSVQLKDGTKTLSDSAGQLSAGASVLSDKLGELKKGQIQLQNGISQLSEGSNLLEDGTNKLVAGQQDFTSGMKQFGEKFTEAKAGGDKLTSGASVLVSGMNQLTAGSSAITSGAGQLADGSDQLKEGTTKLSDGAKELADKLADGAKEASKVHSDDKTYNMMADPVKLTNEKINHVPNYGTGFAPYFLSLGLFVGALLLSIVFPLRDAAVVPSSGFNWFISKFSIMAGVGIIQAIVADIILLAGLGLEVQSIPNFILFSIVTSLTFVTLIQLLVSVFADAGRFLAIVILIFQLTTSAGTFPLELIPNFLQHFNAFLPMTYSVQGFKAVISSGDFSFMWQNIIILLSFLAAFALVTILYFIVRHRHQIKHQNTTLVSE